MRILQLAPIWETVPPPAYGGTEAVVHVLTEELVRRGHDVTLWASGDSCTAGELRFVKDVSLRAAGLTDSALQYAIVHVVEALRDAGNFDIVHSHTGPPSELGMALSSMTPTPMLTTLHNLLTEDTRFIWENYLGWYNTISEEQARLMPRPPLAKNAGVVHNSIDVATFPFAPEKQDYLLFIGRMTPDKAPHLAIEAARKAGRRLIIAGKVAMPDERAYFDAMIRPEIDGHNVEFVGEADAKMKRELFAGARALLVPLMWDEPFGLVMIEAMACGTPPIVFRRGAASELVTDGETGFLVDTVDAMVSALDKIDRIDPWRCRAEVEERFSPTALADRYLAIYEKILGVKEEVTDEEVLA